MNNRRMRRFGALRSRAWLGAVALAIVAALAAAACSNKDTPTPAGGGGGAQSLNRAGATFPQPVYEQMFADYATKTKAQVNYQPVGSGGGIKQFSAGTVDFGATDAAMKDDELSAAEAKRG